jgi:hypothetical protein
MLLNQKHENFCLLTLQGARYGWSQAEIYQRSGFKARGASAAMAASRLMKKDNIRLRIAELGAPIARKAATTVQSRLDELELARSGATSAEQYGAAVNAITTKARITGKLIDRHEIAEPGGFDACQSVEDCVRLMLQDQTPAECLELIDVIRREVEVYASDHADVVAVDPPSPKNDMTSGTCNRRATSGRLLFRPLVADARRVLSAGCDNTGALSFTDSASA